MQEKRLALILVKEKSDNPGPVAWLNVQTSAKAAPLTEVVQHTISTKFAPLKWRNVAKELKL